LLIGSDVNNSGLIEATGGGTLDIKTGTIGWTGGTATVGSNASYLPQ